LPVLEDASFQEVQSQIKRRQQIIQTQKRVIVKQEQVEKKALFGLISKTEIIDVRTTQMLTFEDQFHELERLVSDYDKLLDFITKHKQEYLQFFTQLTSDFKQVVREKLKKATLREQKRRELLARDNIKSEDIIVLESQKEQILYAVWLLGKAFLLMLKKIESLQSSIEQITTDQDSQRRSLIVMVQDLDNKREIYANQRAVNELVEEAGEIAKTVVNLEQYLKPIFGSFQGLINRVCEQDSSLSTTIYEIQSLAEDIMGSNTGSFMTGMFTVSLLIKSAGEKGATGCLIIN
jgi:hypothetical protein